MQEIIKQAGPSRQLFETVNFAFMKIFDFLIKTALFWTFLLFFGDLRHKHARKSSSVISCRVRFLGVICDANHQKKVERSKKGLF